MTFMMRGLLGPRFSFSKVSEYGSNVYTVNGNVIYYAENLNLWKIEDGVKTLITNGSEINGSNYLNYSNGYIFLRSTYYVGINYKINVANGNLTQLFITNGGYYGYVDGIYCNIQYMGPSCSISSDLYTLVYLSDGDGSLRIIKSLNGGATSVSVEGGFSTVNTTFCTFDDKSLNIADCCSDNLYSDHVLSCGNNRIWRDATCIAGSIIAGHADGPTGDARFGELISICSSSNGDIFVLDLYGDIKRIRKISNGYVTTIQTNVQNLLSIDYDIYNNKLVMFTGFGYFWKQA